MCKRNHQYSTEKELFGLFNDSFHPVMDGVTLTVVNYCRGLVERGKAVSVITPWTPVTPPSEGFSLLRYFSVPIYNRHPYRYGYPKLDPFIWSRIRRQPFKLIHAHCPFSSGRLAVYCARRNHIPLIGTFHSKYRTDLEHSLPESAVRYTMKRILDFFNACDEVWIPQAHVEETVREYGFKGRLTVVDNGNDLVDQVPVSALKGFKDEARRQLGIKPSTLSLLFVGQHIIPKGLDIIIEALRLLPRDLDWRMDFIGNGYYASEAQRLIDEEGLADKTRFHGLIMDREELKRHYAASDLFLFPSMYDNAPLVVREAAAMGSPSILPVGSTASEVIVDGQNGFLCERTAADYANIITRLAESRNHIAEVGLGARATLTRSWENVIDEVLDRYRHLIERE